MLIHLLLNFTAQYAAEQPAYLRVLGFNQTGQKILKEMKQHCTLPIMIRPARQRPQLMLALDCRATNLYDMGYALPSLRTCNRDLLKMPVQV